MKKTKHHPIPKQLPPDPARLEASKERLHAEMFPSTEPTMADLEAKCAEIYRQFMPTLREYTRLAGEALAIQIEIYSRRLAEIRPAVHSKLARVVTFSAKDSPASFEAMLSALTEKKIAIESVIFDPARAEFHLFAAAPHE
jgi:hypothetical protein